jgi:hypothetical protein
MCPRTTARDFLSWSRKGSGIEVASVLSCRYSNLDAAGLRPAV